MIHVLPLDELAAGACAGDVRVTDDAIVDPLAWATHRRFTSSGRAALDAVLAGLALAPGDEVWITNTSGQSYVSACVTCTVFNHCRPSRVPTERTRAIIAIHEYGYPHPDLPALAAEARAQGIPLIEDCAHSLDSTLDGAPLGSWGDYAIFSLSKVAPVVAGGVLVGREGLPDAGADGAAAAAYAEQLPALAGYSERRRANAAAVRRRFSKLALLLEPGPGVTPWYLGLLCTDAPAVRRRSDAVQWGSTLRSDLLLVTTNPFVAPEVLVAAVESALHE